MTAIIFAVLAAAMAALVPIYFGRLKQAIVICGIRSANSVKPDRPSVEPFLYTALSRQACWYGRSFFLRRKPRLMRRENFSSRPRW